MVRLFNAEDWLSFSDVAFSKTCLGDPENGYGVTILGALDMSLFFLVCSSPDGSIKVIPEFSLPVAKTKGKDWLNSVPFPMSRSRVVF